MSFRVNNLQPYSHIPVPDLFSILSSSLDSESTFEDFSVSRISSFSGRVINLCSILLNKGACFIKESESTQLQSSFRNITLHAMSAKQKRSSYKKYHLKRTPTLQFGLLPSWWQPVFFLFTKMHPNT